jgi:hypothetical protein
MPNALAPWRSQNWKRREKYDPSAPAPSRLQMRMEAKQQEDVAKASSPSTLAKPSAAATSTPVAEETDPETALPAEESAAAAAGAPKKSLAERAREKKADKKVNVGSGSSSTSEAPKDGIMIGIMDLKILKSMTVSLASYNVFTPKLGHSVWRKHAGNARGIVCVRF